MKIGFIGLGIMGAAMAQHLLAAGHELFVPKRSKVPEALSAATVCAANADVARAAEVIILMRPDTPDVDKVLFGKEGVAEGLKSGGGEGKVVIDMSSISPMETKRFALAINELGCDYLDAPVSGGEVGAKAASLTIMIGGDEAVFERMIKRAFNPGFRIALHQKDLNLALAGAKAMGVALPQTASAAQLMQVCAANGWDQLDHSALVKSLEHMAAHEVAKA